MNTKKEKYSPILHLMERMAANGNLKIQSEIEFDKKEGGFRIDSPSIDTTRAMSVFDALMTLKHEEYFREFYEEVQPLDANGNPIPWDDFLHSLLNAANLFAQKALALNENINPDLN